MSVTSAGRPTMSTATWVPTVHTWQAVAAGGTPIGHKGMIVAAKSMALTAVENPGILMEAPSLRR